MSMITWVKKENNSSAVIFVHGLKGGQETWSFNEGTSFPSLLASEPQLAGRFDIGCFNYFTTFTNTYGVSKSFFDRIFGSRKSIRKNLPIAEIAQLLRTEFEVNLSDYEKVVVIAHSMGGLVSKACILSHLEETQATAVKGFISLAVPHAGAKIANIASFLSSNVQLADLNVLSDAVYQLSRDWVNATTPPPAKYIYGAHDKIVDKKSALAIESLKKDSIAVDEDHTSICKPKSHNETVYKAVVKYILEFEALYKPPLIVRDFQDNNQYDDHFFVLKMVLADVHESITGHAKGYYFNAEEARKLFTSDRDKKLLGVLYGKVKEVYRQEFEHHIANKTTPDQFVQRVHARIMAEDSAYLKTVLAELDGVHKKGMIHQLANKADASVVWSSDTKLDDILAKREAKP
ncbi:ABC-three component system protein [Pseudomonas aeruginosa]|uniref:ABC-three component system protein n=1 Tax=Pseudomonas aeruginosa TaxID=287 RepID=UPI0009A5DC38|nr:ABC-three component system protein [Pseudomonas aeruginosa]MDT8259346.1 hypothetical protein [Pseudomonas aeruginosa]